MPQIPQHAKLPKLEVRKFDGKVHEWQEFWDCFVSAINENETLSKVVVRFMLEHYIHTCLLVTSTKHMLEILKQWAVRLPVLLLPCLMVLTCIYFRLKTSKGNVELGRLKLQRLVHGEGIEH